ncbi:MAG: ComF family protein [Spirochaetales bacterium]
MKDAILDVLFPERCVLCGDWIPRHERPGAYPLCRGCYDLFRMETGEKCRVCSLELTSEQGICTGCRNLEFSFQRNISLFPYRNHGQEVILAYKSRGNERLSLFFAELLLPVWRKEFPHLPVVPVPPRPEGLRTRGFDPVGRICRDLSRIASVPVLPMLYRRRGTQEQKRLNREGREENLKEAFFLGGSGEIPPTVVLLDDVFTTGTTLHRCGEVLKQGGVQEVYGLTLARD